MAIMLQRGSRICNRALPDVRTGPPPCHTLPFTDELAAVAIEDAPPAQLRSAERRELYARSALLTAVFAVPLALDLGAYETFGLPKVTTLWCLTAVAVVLWWGNWRRFPRSRLAIAATVFILGYGVATAFSQAKAVSIVGLPDRHGGLIPHALYVVIMLAIIAMYWERRERLRELAWAIVLSSMVVTSYMLLQAAGLDLLRWYDASSPTQASAPVLSFGTVGNSNFAGAQLAIALPVFAYLILTAKPQRRPLLTALFALQVLAIWYSQSRGGMLSALVGLAVFALVAPKHVPHWIKRLALAALLLAITCLAVFVVRTASRPSEGGVPTGILDAGSLQSRVLYWVVAGGIFADHPLMGTGPDTYYANYLPKRSAAAGARSGLQPTDKPHNVILEYAANTGLVGVVPYLTVVGLAIRYGLRRAREVQGHLRLLVAGFLAALCAYMAQAVVSIDVVSLAALNWIVLGGIAAAADPSLLPRQRRNLEEEHVASRTRGPGRRRVGFAMGLATLAALVVVGTLPLRASVRAANADFQGALRLTPYFGEYPEREGILTMAAVRATQKPEDKLALLTRARYLFEKADRLLPNDLEIHLQTAYMYTIWGTALDPRRYGEAIDAWARLLALDPHDPELRATYTQVKDQMRGDLTQWDAAALAKPDDPVGWILVARGFLALGDAAAARPALERALRADPGNAEALQLLAGIPS